MVLTASAFQKGVSVTSITLEIGAKPYWTNVLAFFVVLMANVEMENVSAVLVMVGIDVNILISAMTFHVVLMAHVEMEYVSADLVIVEIDVNILISAIAFHVVLMANVEMEYVSQGRRSELKVEGAERVNITESRNSTA